MDTDPLEADLKKEVEEGRLVVIAGTGVSVASCHRQKVDGHEVARWDGLLLHGLDYCVNVEHVLEVDDASLLRPQIHSGKPKFLISAAEMIAEALNQKRRGAYRAWLKDTVGRLQATHPELPRALASLGGVLATLNYDGLLEQATGRQSLTWLDRDEVEEVLRGNENDRVLHLHGFYESPDSVVLGLKPYAKVAEDPHASTVLRALLLERTLLFVGCRGTVNDPNFARLVEWAGEALKESTHRHFLLCQESELAAVREELKSAPWLFALSYGTGFERLLPFVQRLAPPPGATLVTPKKPSFSRNLEAYAKALRERYARLKLESMDETGAYYREMQLWRLFIPQNVRECQEFLPQALELPKEHLRRLRESGQLDGEETDPDELQALRRRYLEQELRNALELLEDQSSESQRLVILGDPGSGKSSLLQAFAVRWTNNSEVQRLDLELPLLVELRAFALATERGQTTDFFHFMAEGLGVPCRFTEDDLRALLEEGKVVVLFDGLDEVFDPALRESVANAILRFANDFHLARIVVTSRVIGYQGEAFRSAGFRHYMLQELDEDQIAHFLDKWHADTYGPVETAERNEKHARLANAIGDSAAIRELAGNPLLLTMMAILNRHRDLPRGRDELYEACSSLLLQRWKVEEALRADPELAQDALAIGLREKQAILRQIARAMQSGGEQLGNLIPAARLEAVIEDAVKPYVRANPRAVARALIRHLRERNFILCFAGGDRYAFVHRTFLEYYCATELLLRFEKEQTLSPEQLKQEIYGRHWQDETWHEVLCLLAGMLAPKFVVEVLNVFLAQRDDYQSCQHIFLAARCLGEVRKRDELGQVETQVQRAVEALSSFDFDYYYAEYSPEDMRASAIRCKSVRVRANVWPRLEETKRWLTCRVQSDEDSDVRGAAVEALARGWKSDPETLPWLKTCAQSDENGYVRRAAIAELARGWKNDPETLPILKACAQSDEDSDVRQAAVEALARGWKNDPETLRILKARVQSEEDKYVSQAAVAALARGWKNDPEMLSWLKARAQSDENEFVRAAVVKELARGWKSDPDTLPLLKSRARSDESRWVRRAAVAALAQSWKSNPHTLPWLKSRARSDENGHVRAAAVAELARGWKSDPDTLPLLKSRVQSDENEYVRGAAMFALARGWKSDPDTLPLLKSRAQSDESVFVRYFAVEKLARDWQDEPETLPILKARARSDDSEYVRQAIVAALARGWKSAPETLPWLRDLAQFDESEWVRKTAVSALARGWKSAPETLPWLRDLALSDEDSDVRGAAVEALARGWKSAPETLPWLKARAQSDESEWVRQAAVNELARGWKSDPEVLSWLKAQGLR